MDIASIVKNRILGEKRFYLNKSNTKWLSIGIVPGFEALNGSGFVAEARIVADNGKFVSLGVPAKAGLESLMAIFKNILTPNSKPLLKNSTGIIVKKFAMNNGMAYNVFRGDQTICIGHASIEGLVENESFISAYLKNMKIKTIENSFQAFLIDQDIDKVIETGNDLEIDLHTNFSEFVQLCIELKNDSSSNELDDTEADGKEACDDDEEPLAKRTKLSE